MRNADDSFRSMEFHVSRVPINTENNEIQREDNVTISVDLRDYDSGTEMNEKEKIVCTRYTKAV